MQEKLLHRSDVRTILKSGSMKQLTPLSTIAAAVYRSMFCVVLKVVAGMNQAFNETAA